MVRLHIHHEKGSDDCIENRGSFFSCTPEFVDYLREPGHPGTGHSSAQDWGFKLAPPVMTKVYLLWALLLPFFSFPPFWQKHCTNPSWIVLFMRLCLNSAKQSVIIECEVGLVCRERDKLTSICHFILFQTPGVKRAGKPGCTDQSKRSSYSNTWGIF